MTIRYKVEGNIDVDLTDLEIKKFNSYKSETMKKDYLEQVLCERLETCSDTAYSEANYTINFDELFIVRDWDRFAGNMKHKKELHGSPLAIFIENISNTEKEILESTMNEIGNRKKNKKNKI